MGIDVEVVEHCEISPATGELEEREVVEAAVVGLSMMDIPWLFFSPTQPLFLYRYPHSLFHFTSTALPLLKLSLSRSLLLSFPLSARLHLHPSPPFLLCSSSHTVSLTVAVAAAADADADDDDVFDRLSTHHPRDASLFHPLVPSLPAIPISNSSSNAPVPLFAAQVTVFPNSGLCLGLACHHVVADARTFNLFLKAWASLSRQLSSPAPHPSSLRGFFTTPPYYDRTVLRDPRGLLHRFLSEWCGSKWQSPSSSDHGTVGTPDRVRSTFVVGTTEMDGIREWILSRCNSGNLSRPPHLSPYVLTCAFLWVVWVKAHFSLQAHNNPKPNLCSPVYFGFIAGGLTRLGYPVPASYFGNCVGFGRVEATAHELVGENCIVVAANALGSTVKRLDKDLFADAERWISDWRAFSESELHVTIAGSPKVDLYDTDFGWGRPRKIEDISIDKSRAISLHESRDGEGGIEVGVALPKPQMDAFTSLFTAGLKVMMMKQTALPNPNP
ncbi:anthocyanidin 3-O-glucoside 6''-O-acyltransferase-like [Rhodamnia argentea]|uniref:Anthocyanidin 3-O-glucoside 6''-O-acyltransferase-like n=1 Tax=Rhodamnia argentea TaxID=178133 RepID=A0A8B8MZ08_9MYRT|nr:anthocyanidin 3-O-glucoside 6''-O-acyltransferase-like [Rhodamnia argentea]